MIRGGVITYGLTDHDLIFAIIKKAQSEKLENATFTCRDLRFYTIESLQAQLDMCDWTRFFETENPNELWNILYHNYIKCLDIITPLTTLNSVKPKKTWVSSELLHLIRKRDEYKDRADRLLENDAYIEFKKLKSKVKHKTITAKREFIMGKIDKAQTNPRKYWKELNNVFIPANNSKELVISLKDGSDEIPAEKNS